jgi:hypothetical protein
MLRIWNNKIEGFMGGVGDRKCLLIFLLRSQQIALKTLLKHDWIINL